MKLFLILISVYQKIISPIIKNVLGTSNFCRFSPSCSEYAKQSILKYGVLKGGYLSIIRILSCRPGFKGFEAKV